MKFETTFDDGLSVEFECEDTIISRWVCESILKGETYPHLPFLDDVRVILDVGANCGATAVYLKHHHPGATIHCFEPASTPRACLERNVAAHPDVLVHDFGLHEHDDEVPLYQGQWSGMGSVIQRIADHEVAETIRLRAAGPWAAEHGIDRIDILKVDVEGVEPEVLRSLAPLLPSVQACYLEYDSRQARRDIAALFAPTHWLYSGMLFLDQGECVYLRADLADTEEAKAHLLEILRARAERQRAAGTAKG